MKKSAWWMLLLAVLSLSLVVACGDDDDDDDDTTPVDTTETTDDTDGTGTDDTDTGNEPVDGFHDDVNCSAAVDETGDICSHTVSCACEGNICSNSLWGEDDPSLIEFACYPPCQDVEEDACAYISEHHVCVAYDEEGTVAACHGSGAATAEALDANLWILGEEDQLSLNDIVQDPAITVTLNGETKTMDFSYGVVQEIEGTDFIYVILEGQESMSKLWRLMITFPAALLVAGTEIPAATSENDQGYSAFLQKMSIIGQNVVGMSIMGISTTETAPIGVTAAEGSPCTYPDEACAAATLSVDIDLLEATVKVELTDE